MPLMRRAGCGGAVTGACGAIATVVMLLTTPTSTDARTATSKVDAPASPLPWSWDRLPTFTYGTNSSCCPYNGTNAHCCSGVDSPAEVLWKTRYDLVLIDNELSTPGCLNSTTHLVNWTQCNDFKAAQAGAIKAVDPTKPTFVYRGGPFGCFDMGTSVPGDPAATWLDYLVDPPVTRTVGETWLVGMDGKTEAGSPSPMYHDCTPVGHRRCLAVWRRPTGTCDFRKEAAQNYWLTQMVFGPDQRWLLDDRIDGMFSDSGVIMGFGGDKWNITVGTRRQLFNATGHVMHRMAAGLQSHGKVLTFSLKDHFSNITHTGGGTSGGTLCDPTPDPSVSVHGLQCFPYGEEVLVNIITNGDAAYSYSTRHAADGPDAESDPPSPVVWMPFREYNIPSRDFGKDNATAQWYGCAAAIEDHAYEARRLPGMTCNNDGSFNATTFPSPFGNLSWYEQHKMSLAAHMLGMEEGSYFESGMHWDDIGWHVWWPEYDLPLGAPLGPYTRSGFKFSRSFEHVDVSADCQTLQATFDWHEPTPPQRRSANLSVARTNGVGASVRDTALFAGGYTDSKGVVKSDVVDVYNATSDAWRVAHMSTGRTLFAGASLGDVAMFGCGETNSVKSETDSVDVWDASLGGGAGGWRPVEHLSVPRKKCSATSVALARAAGSDGRVTAGKIVFAGGWPLGGHAPTAAVDIWDLATGKWSAANMSLGRMYMSAASAGPYAVFAGGLSADGDSDVVDILDAMRDQWFTSALVQPQREGAGAGALGGAAFFGGGHSQVWSAASKAWTVRNDTTEWAKMVGTSAFDGRYAVFAGGVGCPGNECAAVEVWDSGANVWGPAPTNLTVARQYAMAASVGRLVVVAGGLDRAGNSSAAVDFVEL